jgi:hypothetical protein
VKSQVSLFARGIVRAEAPAIRGRTAMAYMFGNLICERVMTGVDADERTESARTYIIEAEGPVEKSVQSKRHVS